MTIYEYTQTIELFFYVYGSVFLPIVIFFYYCLIVSGDQITWGGSEASTQGICPVARWDSRAGLVEHQQTDGPLFIFMHEHGWSKELFWPEVITVLLDQSCKS